MTARAKRSWRCSFAALAVMCIGASARADSLDTLVAAYPRALAGRDGHTLIFRDGTRMNAGISDIATPFATLISHAAIRDMFRIPYPAGAPVAAPTLNFDPGRFRNKEFFDRLYGDCRKGEVEKNLVSLAWLAKSANATITFTNRNGAAEALQKVSAEIDALPPDIRRAAAPIAGTYACRGVADQGQPSMHAYGAAIDLNLDYSNYWLWDGHGKEGAAYRNHMPSAIVTAFERHGFIWGGRWYHYDTMHFEYRPELLAGTPEAR
jgi:hypothetical protein